MTTAYPEYKESGIDWINEIPNHWDIKRFKNLFVIKKDIAGTLGFDVLSITQRGIKVKDIESGGGQVASDYTKYQKVNAGDFAMNHMDLLTGFVDISKYDGVTSPDYRVFTLEESKANKSYYLYLLQLGYTNKIFYPLGQGAAHIGRWRLPAEAFKEFRAPCPPENEQKDIAEFLGRETARIDNLITEKQNFIKLLKEKRQALISHVVTKGLDSNVKMKDSGIEWIGEVPERWISTRLKFLVSKIIDTEHKTIPFVDSSDYLVVRTSDIREGGLLHEQCRRTDPDSFQEWTRRGLPSPGDLIFTREAPAGEACIVPTGLNVCLGQRTVLIKLTPSLLAEYLLLVIYSDLTKEFIDNASIGATVKHLNMADIPNIPLLLPDVETQRCIVETALQEMTKINELRKETLGSIELLKEHRTALISAAVTGKIDIRDQA